MAIVISDIRCRVQKRDENPPVGFEQLLPPFRTIVTFVGVPSLNWKTFLKERFGSGRYLVTIYGRGLRGTLKIWHGTV